MECYEAAMLNNISMGNSSISQNKCLDLSDNIKALVAAQNQTPRG